MHDTGTKTGHFKNFIVGNLVNLDRFVIMVRKNAVHIRINVAPSVFKTAATALVSELPRLRV